MREIILICVLAAGAASATFIHSEEMVQRINAEETSYKAKYYPNINFEAMMHDQDERRPTRDSSMPTRVHTVTPEYLPTNFDARNAWPNCNSIKEVRNQADCGNCWAVAAASAISDRACIHSNGTFNSDISATDLTTCCPYCFSRNGCRGGDHYQAWRYWVEYGIVTGGSYESNQGCAPYFTAPCPHPDASYNLHCHGPTYAPDYKGTTVRPTFPPAPECPKQCKDGYKSNWVNDKHYGRMAYNFRKDDINSIKYEIMTYGPLESSFHFTYSFLAYSSGIYSTSGTFDDWHAVKLVGWGVENGVEYWIVANSFGADWGEKGFFRKKMNDTADDEFLGNVTGGMAKLV